MKELFVHFFLGERRLCSYDLKHEFGGERQATIEQLAYENSVDPDEIRVLIGEKNARPDGKEEPKVRMYADEMSVHELMEELRSREEVVAAQVWQKEDIENALETEAEISHPTKRLMKTVCTRAKAALEDCSEGWEVIYSIIRDVVK